ncbi:MAG: RHS repeat protein, partial [Gammaproteobacteria bacterium]|nr:RHS repeat protein [Gammaproteobacteria bacterium]
MIVGPGTSRRVFQPDSRPGGAFFSLEGDHGTLTDPGGGAFRLEEADGSARAFRTDGLLDYIEDTNGNRITGIYISGQLTSLTHTGGQTLGLTYTPAGLLETVADPDGRVTIYTYDSIGEHLDSVSRFDGTTTRYSYSTGVSARQEHALIEIEYAGNRHQYFNYDDQGRLEATSRDGGAELTTFGYGSSGLVAVQNAALKTWFYYRDQYGRLLKIVDPNGNQSRSSFDDESNLVTRTDPAGLFYRYDYNARGNLTKVTDPLGHSTELDYSIIFNRMTRLTDARGNETSYIYDGSGNLDGIVYPGGGETWTHDEYGNPNSWTNRRSNSLSYEYDGDGRLTARVNPDLSRIEYRYEDGRGNLTSFTDSTGTTTLTYYIPEDRLKRMTDPDGRWLKYTYNPAGQRASMLNQLGHRLDYTYNPVGRLQSIFDEAATEIVRYTYDAVGRLERKDLQNGVYTLYGYDDASQLTSLVNYRPDDSILSRFLYTYDERGRRYQMATLEGQWTYCYDVAGQLTSSVAPDGRLIQYEYDATGNRSRVIDDGVVTDYTSNSLNQYTGMGGTTY